MGGGERGSSEPLEPPLDLSLVILFFQNQLFQKFVQEYHLESGADQAGCNVGLDMDLGNQQVKSLF